MADITDIIANPEKFDPISIASGIADLRSKQNANNLFQAQALNNRAIQLSTNPDGSIDPNKFNVYRNANPKSLMVNPQDAIKAGQGLQAGGLTNLGTQSSNMYRDAAMSAASYKAQNPDATPADIARAQISYMTTNGVGNHAYSMQQLQNMIGSGGLNAAALEGYGLDTVKTAGIGTTGTVNTPSGLQGTKTDLAGNITLAGNAIPNLSQGDLATLVSATGPDGSKIQSPYGSILKDPTNPSLGLKDGWTVAGLAPSRVENSGQNSGATMQPLPNGHVIQTTRSIAQEAQAAAASTSGVGTAQAALNFKNDSAQIPIRKSTLANLSHLASDFAPGNLSHVWEGVGATAAQFGIPLPKNFGKDAIASQQEFGKLSIAVMRQQASAQGFSNTDASTALVSQAIPNDHLTPAGIQKVIGLMQGNEDYLGAEAKAYKTWTDHGHGDETFNDFRQQFNQLFDPRLFQVQYGSDTDRKALQIEMNKKSPGSYERQLLAAKRNGYLGQ